MLGLDPSISGREGAPFGKSFSGLRYASPENDAPVGQPFAATAVISMA